jgi:cytochrome c oxidase subunit 2
LLVRQAPGHVPIRVTGHQWWWEVLYEDKPERSFVTANEIYVPVGEPITVTLETRDVIHSFWVPSLHGKMDQISGHENQLQFSASRPGVYWGQCAEFCGLEHAKMAFNVVAVPRPEFELWQARQLSPAESPIEAVRQQGLLVFLSRGCMLCHTIRGTLAGGRLGPDLTHLASRRSLAAGTLANNAGSLAGWIADPQHVKPGNFMPNIELSGEELAALAAYLTELK